MEGTESCPHRIDTYSGFGFVILACNTSASTTIRVLLKCLIHHHGIPHNIASNQGIHFSAKEVWQWVSVHGLHWCCHVLYHLEAAGLK